MEVVKILIKNGSKINDRLILKRMEEHLFGLQCLMDL